VNVSRLAVERRAFFTFLVVAALFWGATSFLGMSRREDPEIRIRVAKVVTRWPGAPATKVEQLVTDIVEDAIAGIEEVETIASTSEAGVSIVSVELADRVTDLDQVWDEVRAELVTDAETLPQGCGDPELNANFGDVSPVCFALYQVPAPGRPGITRAYDDRELEQFAEILQEELEEVDAVADVSLHGVQEERIEVVVDAAAWSRLGLSTRDLARAIDERNIVASGGLIETDRGRYVVRPTGEFGRVQDLLGVVVASEDEGPPVLLGDLDVSVERGYEDPRRSQVRFTSPEHRAGRAIVLAAEMKGGQNVVEMGEAVAARAEAVMASRMPPDLALTRVNDLPRQVDTLVRSFVTNLWQAIVIVLGVALVMMGWRPALIMATAVPLCMIVSIAIVRLLGVELEQFSIASLIIALGMIVDNAIVVSDNVVHELRAGKGKVQAAVDGAQGLAIPVLTSTLTTVGAFLPLLTIEGSSGEYMRSLPIVVSTTLLVSYAVALTVTPLMSFYLLKRPRGGGGEAAAGRFERLYTAASGAAVRAWPVTLGAALALFLASLLIVPVIGTQFFPGGYRDQFFVHVELPRGAGLGETEAVCARVEDALLATSEGRLGNATTFVGTGGPRMMLTMSPKDPAPHRGFVLVNTTEPAASEGYVDDLRARVAAIPGARIEVKRFMLGPGDGDPVAFRIKGPSADVLRSVALAARRELAAVEGALEPRDDWGNASYEVEVDVDTEAANLAGVTNKAVADSLAGLLSGAPLTTYREGDRSIDVVLRLERGQRERLAALGEVYVDGARGKLPLAAIAEPRTGWQPSMIARHDRTRAIRVSSQVADGYLAPEVSAAALPRLRELVDALPPGYSLEEEGEAKDSREGQENMGGAFGISLVVILLVLVTQYDSILKPFVVLTAVPLAVVGALVGLLLSGWPLGFMPLLGIVSLAGVVINNAIILIDAIEGLVAEGTPLRAAVTRAGARRMKPILLTTLTTVGGLLPLALAGGPMWEGMAWAMIVGLSGSTVMTLLVVPTIYVVFAERLGMRVVRTDGPVG